MAQALGWLIGLCLVGFLLVYAFAPQLIPSWLSDPLNIPTFQLDPNPVKTYSYVSYILSDFPPSTQVWSNWYAWFDGSALSPTVIGTTDANGALIYSRQCLLGTGSYEVSVWTGTGENKRTLTLDVEYGSGGDVGASLSAVEVK